MDSDKVKLFIVFALGVATPWAILIVLQMLFGGAVFLAFLFLLCVVGVWTALRPHFVAVSIALFWIAVFFFLASFTLDTHAPATVTFAEAEFYGACFGGLIVASLTLGLLTAVIGIVMKQYRSWQEHQEE